MFRACPNPFCQLTVDNLTLCPAISQSSVPSTTLFDCIGKNTLIFIGVKGGALLRIPLCVRRCQSVDHAGRVIKSITLINNGQDERGGTTSVFFTTTYLHNVGAGHENVRCVNLKLAKTFVQRCAPLCTERKIEPYQFGSERCFNMKWDRVTNGSV